MTAATQSAAPPMPAEHGAWVVLSVPILVTWIAFPPSPLPAALLVLSVAAAWLAQSTAPAAGRGVGSSRQWLTAELMVLAAAGLALLLGWRLWPLVPLGVLAAVFAGAHLWMRGKVIQRRLDRSEPGELIGVVGLCLTAPAAYVVSRGRLDENAAVVFAACTLFFFSGVLFVQMLLKRLRARSLPGASRWGVARNVAIYHGGLAILLAILPAVLPVRTSLLVVAAFAPALVRAMWGIARYKSQGVPSFKKIGVMESVYAAWFAVLIALALPGASRL
jgi:hypothetical protein